MKRRQIIKKILVASGGLVALPSWANEWTVGDGTFGSTTFIPQDQATLASVADTIIPAGNAIGALSVGVDQFLQKLIDVCYEKPVGDNVKAQLQALEAKAQQTHGKSFSGCDQVQRQELLIKFSVSEDKSEKDFFNLMKSETIRGFNTSREVMVNYLKFKQVPGHYYGCVDVNA
jgi:Gluconate 2-dehydrogenase subunit 3